MTARCGIDLGWRLMADGSLRVAYLVGSDGQTDELHLPPGLLARWRQVRDLASIRTDALNGLKARLAAADRTTLPDWLGERLAGAAQWRSPGRFARLLADWQPFAGGEDLHAALAAWHDQDAHLWQWERALAAKADRVRRDLYRKFAARVGRRYGGIGVEDCDWRALATHRPAEADDAAENATARWHMRLAAVGLLRRALLAKGAVPVGTADTTRNCHACGEGPAEGWDARELVYCCANGHIIDQDENAARNLLAQAKPAAEPKVHTLVYQYGARPPVEGGELVAAQMSAAHLYHNTLVELHREFAAAREDAKRRHVPGLDDAERAVADLDGRLTELRAAVRKRNAAARRKTATAEDRQAVADLRERLRDARDERRRLRAAARDNAAYRDELDRLVAEYQGERVDPDGPRRVGGKFKAARAQCGVYWGTYLEVEKAVEAAVERSLGPPRFKRWTGDGRVCVQLQGGLSVPDLFGADSRVRLEPRPPKQLLLWLRIGSEGRAPVWCKAPLYYHRPLPEAATVTGVALVRRQSAVRRAADGTWRPYYDWSAHFTVRLASGEAVDESPGTARESDAQTGPGIPAGGPAVGGRWARRKADRSRRAAESGVAQSVRP